MVDCRLHAVAPELLEACNFITDLCDPKTDCMSDEGKIQRINEIARTAIAKAEGGKV